MGICTGQSVTRVDFLRSAIAFHKSKTKEGTFLHVSGRQSHTTYQLGVSSAGLIRNIQNA